MNTVQALYSNWKNLLQTTNTSGNEEFQWTTDELKKNVKNIEWDLQDLDETLTILFHYPPPTPTHAINSGPHSTMRILS